MKEIHPLYEEFKREFREVSEKYSSLGKEIHLNGGPLDEKTRWLIKCALSASNRSERALETHILKAGRAGASDEEILHALLLLIPTLGFPVFMEAYGVFKNIIKNK